MMLERSVAVLWPDEMDDVQEPLNRAVQTAPSPVASHHFTVVVLDSAASLQAGWVLDVLAEANRVGDAARFTWDVLSFQAYMEAERAGRSVDLAEGGRSRAALFLAAETPDLRLSELERERLRKSVRQLSLSLACGPAVELFAACSVLKDKSAAACRTTRAWLREKYPEISFLDAPLHWSGTIGTSAGGATIAAATLDALGKLGLSPLAREIGGRLLIPTLKVERPGLSPRARFGARSTKIAKAVAFMERNLEEELQVEAVASHVGTSVRQLERLFKTQMATTPARFLKRLRLGRARELLVNTELSIVQIGCATGFESPTHFAKCFKRSFSVPPTKWRQHRRRASAIG